MVLIAKINVILVGFRVSLFSKKMGKIRRTAVMINKENIRDNRQPP